jgi:hypothetical protein
MHAGTYAQHHNELMNGIQKDTYRNVSMAIIDTLCGRYIESWDDAERKDLRAFVDFMLKEGAVILLFCKWQDASIYKGLFEETVRVPHTKAGEATHSKYECQPAAYCLSKNDKFVVPRPQAKSQAVSAWEMALVVRRFRTPSLTSQGSKPFFLLQKDRMLNVKEAALRFCGKVRPNDGAKWVSTCFTGLKPPRHLERLKFPARRSRNPCST